MVRVADASEGLTNLGGSWMKPAPSGRRSRDSSRRIGKRRVSFARRDRAHEVDEDEPKKDREKNTREKKEVRRQKSSR